MCDNTCDIERNESGGLTLKCIFPLSDNEFEEMHYKMMTIEDAADRHIQDLQNRKGYVDREEIRVMQLISDDIFKMRCIFTAYFSHKLKEVEVE